jgi:hypothetical protein
MDEELMTLCEECAVPIGPWSGRIVVRLEE